MKRLGIAILLLTAVSASAQNYPFPAHVNYPGATLYPNHRTQAQKDADVRAYYDYWKSTYLVTAGTAPDGTPMWRVTMGTNDPGRTTSEGMGYGMTIVVFMAGHDPQAQAIFNGLWKFARQHPSRSNSNLMAWEVPEGTDNNSAFDGDADMAYALLLADKQWGSSGAINYRADAVTLINAIEASTIGPASRLPMLGDWVNPSGSLYNEYSPRTSDFMLANFRAYGLATGKPVWSTVTANVQASVNHLQSTYASSTGLLPDFTEKTSSTDTRQKPARAYFLEGPDDGKYSYNAFRVPWRLGLDAVLNNDPTSLAQARKINNWAQSKAGGVPSNLKEPGYTLSGTAINSTWSYSAMIGAPLGVAAMTGNSTQQAWLNALYDSVYQRRVKYYSDTLTMICLLIMTGNHWDIDTAAPDLTPPAVNITYPAPGSVITGDLASINGTASDASGVDRVELAFYRRVPPGAGYEWEFWLGTYWHWDDDPPLTTTLNTSSSPNTWTRQGGLPTGANFPPGVYYIRAIAYDRQGNASPPLYIDFTKQ